MYIYVTIPQCANQNIAISYTTYWFKQPTPIDSMSPKLAKCETFKFLACLKPLKLVANGFDLFDFLHDWPWISPWILLISNELDIIIHVIAPQLSGHCDVISNRLWRHQQNGNRASETRGRCVKLVILFSFIDSLCRVRNKIMYVLSWWTVSAPTRVLFWYLFPSLLRKSGNKHQNNPLVSAETIRHSVAYIILYILMTISCIKRLLFHLSLVYWIAESSSFRRNV